MAKTRRAYTGAAVSTTTASSIAASGTTSFTITAYTGWPYGTDPFYVVVEPGTASEEKILVTRTGSTDTTINVASDSERGQDGTSAVAHSSGSTVFPVFTALDADEANELASKWTSKGDLVSYGSSTFERLGVGTNDYVLTAASGETSGLKWGQVATGGIANDAVTTAKIDDEAVTKAKISTTDYAGMGLVLVKTQTIGTAVSSVTVNDAFSSTFQNYRIVMNTNSASTNNDVLIQFGASTTNYDRTRILISSVPGGGVGVTEEQNQSSGYLGVNHSVNGGDIVADVFRPNDAASTTVFSNGLYRQDTGSMQLRYMGTLHRPATAYTAFTVVLSAGTFTGGTIRVYGYNNG